MNIEQFPVVYHYEQHKPDVSMSPGPERTVTDKPDPDFKPRPVGFTAKETDHD